MDQYLSYLMGGEDISDGDLTTLNIKIVDRTPEGYRMLKVPPAALNKYKELVRQKMTPGFWNEIVGSQEIIFLFRFKDGVIKEYVLSPDNEKEIDTLCAEFNNEPLDKTANVYKSIAENSFYHDFMLKHYAGFIDR